MVDVEREADPMREMHHPDAIRDAVFSRSLRDRSYYTPRATYKVMVVMRDGGKQWFFGGTTLKSARARRDLAFAEDHANLVSHAWIFEQTRP